MAQFTNDSRLNSAIIAARQHGVTVEIDNSTVEVYWTAKSSTPTLYSRLNRHDMADLERDLREAVDAMTHGF